MKIKETRRIHNKPRIIEHVNNIQGIISRLKVGYTRTKERYQINKGDETRKPMLKRNNQKWNKEQGTRMEKQTEMGLGTWNKRTRTWIEEQNRNGTGNKKQAHRYSLILNRN